MRQLTSPNTNTMPNSAIGSKTTSTPNSNHIRDGTGRANPFPVTIDTLVSACCPPIQGWCRHDESHFLRALGTKHHPGFSKDLLVRLVMLHRHDDSPSVGKRLGPMADSRLYKIAHCNLL